MGEGTTPARSGKHPPSLKLRRASSGEPHVFVSADTRKKPLFGNQGKVLNLGNLDLFRISSLGFRVSAAEQSRRSTIVENPLQISPVLCKTKPICQRVKLMQSVYLQRIMKKNADNGYEKTKPKQTQFAGFSNERK